MSTFLIVRSEELAYPPTSEAYANIPLVQGAGANPQARKTYWTVRGSSEHKKGFKDNTSAKTTLPAKTAGSTETTGFGSDSEMADDHMPIGMEAGRAGSHPSHKRGHSSGESGGDHPRKLMKVRKSLNPV